MSENPNLLKYKCGLWRAFTLSEFLVISASHSDLLTTPHTFFHSSVAFVVCLITGMSYCHPLHLAVIKRFNSIHNLDFIYLLFRLLPPIFPTLSS